jgi:hypothetical protein
VGHQVDEEVELARGHGDRPSADLDRAAGDVDLDHPGGQAPGQPVGDGEDAAAPQHRAHAQYELPGAERLDQVVVGAGLEPGQAVALLTQRGEHDHGDVGPGRPQPLADLEPGEPWQHEVEDDEVRPRPGGDGECGRPVGRMLDLEAGVRQVRADDLRHRRVVLDDEHPTAHGPEGRSAHRASGRHGLARSTSVSPAHRRPSLRAPSPGRRARTAGRSHGAARSAGTSILVAW